MSESMVANVANTDAKPQPISIENVAYYNAKDLKCFDPVFFKGFKANIRKIIDKKSIPEEQYMYATHSQKNGWKPSIDQSNLSAKAQLLLTESWVMDNMPNMSADQRDQRDYPPPAPPCLVLMDAEKFHDDDGYAVEIETRGERTSKGVYFKAKDVASGFEMPSLCQILVEEKSRYEITNHYTFFSVEKSNGTVGKEIFITYKGMLKILFSSRTGCADKFVEWATDTLFAAQMGSDEQKETMVSNVIKVPKKTITEVVRLTKKGLPYKKPKRRITESIKKMVAGRQNYKCAASVEQYDCPLYRRQGDGIFDESGYEIDHIEEFSINNNDSDENLQALCLMCHMVKTKRFNQKKKSSSD